jgi:hypothetical protein
MTKLTPAQAAVLSGDITWNADGSVYVTTGRENTLAALRRMGMLHGSLLTTHGFNARVTVHGGSLNVVTPENGESETLFAKQYIEGESVDIMATIKGDTTETAVASVPNGNPADVNRWLDWARNTPTWTNIHAINTPTCTEGHPLCKGNHATPVEPTEGKWDAVLRTTSQAGFHSIPEDPYAAYDAEDVQRAEDDRIGALYDTEDIPVTLSTIETLRDAYSGLEAGKETHVTAMVSGRIGGMRIGGKLCFATITDGTDSIQVITSADRVDPEALTEWKGIPDGSHVTLTGEVTMSKRGILSIMAESWVATEPEPTPEPELTIQLADRKGWVRVSVAGQTMEIRSGSDVRWRAAVWALGHGYRLARKGSRAWQGNGKLSVARVLPA